jgi:hypothetical protein
LSQDGLERLLVVVLCDFDAAPQAALLTWLAAKLVLESPCEIRRSQAVAGIPEGMLGCGLAVRVGASGALAIKATSQRLWCKSSPGLRLAEGISLSTIVGPRSAHRECGSLEKRTVERWSKVGARRYASCPS